MTCDALPAVGVFVAAATPQRLRRAFHSGMASPGLYSGRFLFGALRPVRVRCRMNWQRCQKAKPASTNRGPLTKTSH